MILPQNDIRGKEAVETWITRFTHAKVLDISYENNQEGFEKDFNDIYVQRGRKGASKVLQEAVNNAGYQFQPIEMTG